MVWDYRAPMASSKDSVPVSVAGITARSLPGPAAGAGSELFALPLLHGVCVAVPISGASDSAPSMRARHFAAGRLALGCALTRLGVAADQLGDLAATERGAPRTPTGTTGSISHKHDIAVALAAWRAIGPDHCGDWIVGVDLEARQPTRRDISARVLGADERARLSHLPEPERGLAVVLSFSIKEAIYKAIDPFVQRYVGFREVSVHAHADGRVDVHPALEPAHPHPLEIQAMWMEVHGYYLSAARARSAALAPGSAKSAQ